MNFIIGGRACGPHGTLALHYSLMLPTVPSPSFPVKVQRFFFFFSLATNSTSRLFLHNRDLFLRHQHYSSAMATEITEEQPSQQKENQPSLRKKNKAWNNPNRRAKQELILRSAAAEEVKLAAISVIYNVRLKSSDMSVPMQEHALRLARSFVDSAPTKLPLNNTHLARTLKKEFDSVYGPAWHCVVGKSFGSFVTHSSDAFIYFSLGSLSVLLFQTQLQLVPQLNKP